MNLPQLFLADLPPEAEITPALVRDACIAVKRNRATWLCHHRTQELVELIAFAAERWQQPDNGFRRLALREGAADTGFGPATVARGLDSLFRLLTVEQLHALITQDLGEVRRLDEFSAPPGELRHGRLALARGPELLVHVAAGNLPNSTLMSLVLGLLVRSAQFVKLPRRGSLIPRLFAHSLAELEPKLGGCLEFAVWPGGHSELEAALLAEAECVTVQGADETVSDVRGRLPAKVRLVPYGSRLSFGFISGDVLSSYSARKVAEKAAADVCAWNQLGCLSPHVFYVEDRGAVSAEAFAELLANALAEREAAEPRGDVSLEEAAQIADRRYLHELRSARHVLQRGEAVTMPRGAFFEPASTGTRIWTSEGSTAWTVVFEDDARFHPSCLNRFIYVKPVRELSEALRFAEAHRGQISTVGVGALESKLPEIARELAGWGVPRVCPVGRMQEPPVTWRHDGRPALAELVTWTDLEL